MFPENARKTDLTEEAIRRFLPEALSLSLTVTGEVSSTNALLKEAGAKGAPHGTVLIAESQTAGRGRLGRTFFSPAGSGLYISVLLRPPFSLETSVRLTAAAAVAAAEAVEEATGTAPGIKWVNDLYLHGRKVAGILAESALSEGGKVDFAVLGVGFNLCPPAGGFPAELQSIAGAILPRFEEGIRPRLAAAFLTRFFALFDRLAEEPSPFLDAYRSRCFFLGDPVEIQRGEEVRTAVAESVDGDFSLTVRYPDGAKESLSFGEIRLRFPTKEDLPL